MMQRAPEDDADCVKLDVIMRWAKRRGGDWFDGFRFSARHDRWFFHPERGVPGQPVRNETMLAVAAALGWPVDYSVQPMYYERMAA